MALCRLCSKDRPDDELIDTICVDCQALHGLRVGGEPLRPRVPCDRCGGHSFVRGLALRERFTRGGDHADAYEVPLAITYAHTTYHTVFRSRKVLTPDRSEPRGVLETYTCRACGFVELYARDADSIPVGPEHGTELFEVAGEGPYR